MTLRSRLLLTSAALSLALGTGGFAAAQNRTQQPMQNSAQSQNHNQVPDKDRAQAPNGNQSGAANNNNEAQAPQAQGPNQGSNQRSNQGSNQGADNGGGRMENNARSNQNTGDKGAQAPSSGNAAQNKQPAGTNQNAERGAQPNQQNERQPAAASGNRTNQPAAAERGTERNENAAERGGERNNNAANPAPNRTGNAEQRGDSTRVSARLSSTEKTKLEGALGKISVRPATNVNFSIAVGTSVPRTVVLHPLPADIVAIVPQFRGFDFFVVRDEVVIVEPRNHRIVDVIERTGGARTAETTRSRKLHLSERDRTFIRKHYASRRTVIDRAGPPRETHIVIGEDVPESVTVERFPREVYRRVPSVRSYGYVHEGRDLYLVEPGSRHVIESLGPDED